MTPIPLTPEADAVLDLLEGRRPQDPERFQSLVALLMERHWPALVTPINKRCFSADSSCDLTQDAMAASLDVDRETIRRPLVQRLRICASLGQLKNGLHTLFKNLLNPFSQVEAGIFTGRSQVVGVQAVYGYGRRC